MTLKERNRLLILETAKKMFIEKGFKDSSMNDLANTASIGRKTVYRHFENKDLLLIAIITEYFEAFNDSLKNVTFDPDSDSFTNLEYLLSIYSKFFLQNIEMLHLIGMMDININDESRNSAIYIKFIEESKYPDQIIYTLLEKGKRDKSIKPDINSELISVTINNSLLSLASRAISHKQALDSEQGIESWKMVETLAETLLIGIKND